MCGDIPARRIIVFNLLFSFCPWRENNNFTDLS